MGWFYYIIPTIERLFKSASAFALLESHTFPYILTVGINTIRSTLIDTFLFIRNYSYVQCCLFLRTVLPRLINLAREGIPRGVLLDDVN